MVDVELDLVDACCEKATRFIKSARIAPDALKDTKVHVRRSSHLRPFTERGDSLKAAFTRFGATLADGDDVSLSLERDGEQALLDDIDAFVMLAFTTGVSVEAIELVHRKAGKGRPISERLHVVMPRRFEEGLVRRRLQNENVAVQYVDDQCSDVANAFVKMVMRINEQRTEDRLMEQSRRQEYRPRTAIVTALPIEFAAVKSLLSDIRSRRNMPGGVLRDEVHGTIEAHDGLKHEIVLVQSGMGNNISAIETQRLLQAYALDQVVMVGIAGGVPGDKIETDVRLGDIVFSGRQGVVQYDMGKRKPTSFEPNHPPRPPSENWLRLATAVTNDPGQIEAFHELLKTQAKRDYKRPKADTDKLYDESVAAKLAEVMRLRDPGRRAGRPKVFGGVIGSANKVVKSHRHRENIRRGCGALAVEMEGSGVADAAQINATPYFIVRGICDYANTRKNDLWHPYAAMAAAAFTVTLLKGLPAGHERG